MRWSAARQSSRWLLTRSPAGRSRERYGVCRRQPCTKRSSAPVEADTTWLSWLNCVRSMGASPPSNRHRCWCTIGSCRVCKPSGRAASAASSAFQSGRSCVSTKCRRRGSCCSAAVAGRKLMHSSLSCCMHANQSRRAPTRCCADCSRSTLLSPGQYSRSARISSGGGGPSMRAEHMPAVPDFYPHQASFCCTGCTG